MDSLGLIILAEEFNAELAEKPKTCGDFDSDCRQVRDKLGCFVFDPDKGRCPFLRLPKGAGNE